MECRRFPLAYHIKYSETHLSQEEVPESYGLADQLMILAVVGNENKKFDDQSYSFAALDGLTGEMMDPLVIFQNWIIIAQMLAKKLDASLDERKVCDRAIKSAMDIMTNHGLHPFH